MVLVKNVYKDYKKLTKEVNEEIESKLENISNLDMNKLMSDVEETLVENYKIHYKDENTIMIKVDRRKNINVIQSDIEDRLRGFITDEYISLLFKIRIFDGMITIKRRR